MYYIDLTTDPQTPEDVIRAFQVGYVYGARPVSSGYICAANAFANGDHCAPMITTTVHCTDGDVQTLCFWNNAEYEAWLKTAVGDTTRGTVIASLLGYDKWILARDSVSFTAQQVKVAGTYCVLYTDLDYNGVKADIVNGFVARSHSSYACTITTGAGFAGWYGRYGEGVHATVFSDMMAYMCDHENMNDLMFATKAALDAACHSLDDDVSGLRVDITGLTQANAALYSAVAGMGVFGAKFSDVVVAQHLIEAAGQYIPRP